MFCKRRHVVGSHFFAASPPPMVPSLLDTCSLGSIKSSWLVLSLLFGCAGAVNPNPCPLPPVFEGAKLTTITHDGVSRSWYTYVPASVEASTQADVPLVVDLHGVYTCAVGTHMKYTGWIPKAEEFGFILVWPQAAGRSNLTSIKPLYP